MAPMPVLALVSTRRHSWITPRHSSQNLPQERPCELACIGIGIFSLAPDVLEPLLDNARVRLLLPLRPLVLTLVIFVRVVFESMAAPPTQKTDWNTIFVRALHLGLPGARMAAGDKRAISMGGAE
eukprot:2517323-Pyramimonas_sp.AAC.1